MSLSNTTEFNVLALIFQNTNWANLGDATGVRGSTTPGSLYVSLHTADPGETGTQTTSETAYSGYARVGVPRSAGGWTISGTAPTQAANTSAVTFGAATTSSTVTYFGIGRDPSGAGELMWSGILSGGGLAISSGITPSFLVGTCIASID